MAENYPDILIAVVICALVTGIAIAWIGFQGLNAPLPGQTIPDGASQATPSPTLTRPAGSSGSTQAPAGSPAFSLEVTPATATARPGDTVRYTLRVQPEHGFSDPVHLAVSATAVHGIFRDSRDLGTLAPPYPPVVYEVVAPDLPPLVSEATIDATVTATGGGVEEKKRVNLIVRA
jgi:hypothetical protein